MITKNNIFIDKPITKILIDQTVPYSRHPFRVKSDESLRLLADDIRRNGLLHPIIVRQIGMEERYEILSGHRRTAASRLLGFKEIYARIFQTNDITAANFVIQSNFSQRDKILPSERAKSYLLRREMLKNSRSRIDEDTIKETLEKEFGESASSIFRYIRLNQLIEPLLELVDDGAITLATAVDLSQFKKRQQEIIYHYFYAEKKAVLKRNMIKELREYGDSLNMNDIAEIAKEEAKPKAQTFEDIVRQYRKYFKNRSEVIQKADELLQKYVRSLEKKSGKEFYI